MVIPPGRPDDGPGPDRPLSHATFEDALVVPTRSRALMRVDACAFDAAGRPIADSLLSRTWRKSVGTPPDIVRIDLSRVETIEAPHLYGGPFFDHFGHFLLESLARAWAVEEVGALPMVWVSGGPPRPYQAEVLAMLGLTGGQVFPESPVRFRRLVVPMGGFRIQGQFHPRHARFLARHETAARGGGRVWLSRAGIAPERQSGGEAALQAALAARGWRVVAPETLSLTAQLDLLAGAEVVAGLEGSAFHAAVLLARPAAPLIVLRRSVSANYRAIAAARGILEIDLYGAFEISHRRHFGLHRPLDWAAIVADLADRLALCRDAAAREALRAEAEARHGRDLWLRQQRLRLGTRAGAALRHDLIPGARTSLRRLLGRSRR